MKKTGIAGIVVVSLVMGLMCGCATMGGGKSDEEQIMGVVESLKTAMNGQDIEGIMAVYSEDYRGRRDSGKERMREWLSRAIENDRLKEIEINLEEAVVTIDGDTATAGPISMTSQRGTREFSYNMKKEADGVWRIIGRQREED